jgi:hypothetical protein
MKFFNFFILLFCLIMSSRQENINFSIVDGKNDIDILIEMQEQHVFHNSKQLEEMSWNKRGEHVFQKVKNF